jgi:phenylacetate-CoA ligase
MFRDLLELQRLLYHRKLSSEELNHLQNSKLRAVIHHAYENVPYYQSLFKSTGLSPEDIRSVEDLKHLPITTKEDLRASGLERITAKNIPPSACNQRNTSGASGKPFTVYYTHREARIRRLLEFRALLSIGFHPKDRLSVLGAELPHPARFHERLGFYRSENISVFLPVEEQIRHLEKMRPTVFWAYPTALRTLLHHIDYRLSNIIHPRILITSAEVLEEMMEERLKADLDIELFNFYGAIESGRIASECPFHEGLHINADHLIFECFDGNQPAGVEKPGVVVITLLNAYAMPLIRYRLGDITTLLEKRCSCGSSFPLISPVQGREEDMILLPSGKVLTPHGLRYILKKFTGIDQFCFIQESLDHLVLQLAISRSFQEEFFPKIKADFLEYLSEPIRIDIQKVDFFREDRPKFKTFIGLNRKDR